MPSPSTEVQEVIAHIDGGSRGNPGPAAYGVVVDRAGGTRLASLSKYLGHTTNNIAEYQGLLAALDYALEHGHRRLRIVTDSELLARQISGQYKVKNPNLKILHERARALIAQFDAFRIEHVRREYNREADGLANEALDAERKKKPPQPASAALKPRRVAGIYHQGTLELDGSPHLDEGDQSDLEIRRKD